MSSLVQITDCGSLKDRSIAAVLADSAALLDRIGRKEWLVSREFPTIARVEFLGIIGSGSMGHVYEARQLNLNRTVAVKVLPPELCVDPGMVNRFHREACALARLSHPHIVAIYDHGETEEGDFYLIMERLEGTALNQRLQAGLLAFEDTFRIIDEVAMALEHAHAQGVIHRDIKPSNIQISPAGWITVLDFGIAANLRDKTTFSTNFGTRVGTAEYAAPEQIQALHAVDSRADIYSLGVLAYEMISGVLPKGSFQPPSQLAQEQIHPLFDQLIISALHPDVKHRPASMTDFRKLWRAALHKQQASRSSRHRRYWLGATLLLVAGLGGGFYRLSRPASKLPPPIQLPVKSSGEFEHFALAGRHAEEDRWFGRLQEILAAADSLAQTPPPSDAKESWLELIRLKVSCANECGQQSAAEAALALGTPVAAELSQADSGPLLALLGRWHYTRAVTLNLSDQPKEAMEEILLSQQLFGRAWKTYDPAGLTRWWFSEAITLQVDFLLATNKAADALQIIATHGLIFNDFHQDSDQVHLAYAVSRIYASKASCHLALSDAKSAKFITDIALNDAHCATPFRRWPRGSLITELYLRHKLNCGGIALLQSAWENAERAYSEAASMLALPSDPPLRYRLLPLTIHGSTQAAQAILKETPGSPWLKERIPLATQALERQAKLLVLPDGLFPKLSREIRAQQRTAEGLRTQLPKS